MIYILAYPKIKLRVSRSLAAFRGVHEAERAKLVAPHITLVFGLRNSIPEEITALCKQVASQASVISVEFANSEVVYDPFEKTYKISLVTSVGKDRLTILHEQLYNGSHRREVPPDVPYSPHMTVATNADRSIIEDVDTTIIGEFPIRAKVSRLDVVKLTDGKLSSISSVELMM